MRVWNWNISLLFVFALVASACVTSPLNHTSLPTKATAVTFEGFDPNSDKAIEILVLNTTTKTFELVCPFLINCLTTGDSTEPHKDSTGMVWYPWKRTVSLPRSPQYWSQAGNQLRVQVKVRNTLNDFASFDDEVQAVGGCWWQKAQNGGLAMINACESNDSPIITLTTPCGGPGQSCCNDGCKFGKTCSSDDLCSTACGGSGQACCSGASPCGSGLACAGNACKACGGMGQPCCSGSACKGSSLACKSGSCVVCGGLEQPCCAGNPCGAAEKCVGGMCQSCGGAGQQCCLGIPCAGGNLCDHGTCAGSNQCLKFGESCSPMQPCCANTECLFNSAAGVGAFQCCHSVDSNGCN